MKKTTLFAFIMLLIVPFAYSFSDYFNITVGTIFVNDTFEYADSFSNHNWSYSEVGDTSGYCSDVPLYGSAFGCATGVFVGVFSTTIERTLDVNITGNPLFIVMHINQSFNGNDQDSRLSLIYQDGTIWRYFYYGGSFGNNITVQNAWNAFIVSDTGTVLPNNNITSELIFYADDDKLSIYLNGVEIVSNDTDWSSTAFSKTVRILKSYSGNTRWMLEDFSIFNGTFTEPLVANYTCNDTDGGYNLGEKGTVSLYNNGVFDYNYTDICSSLSVLNEGVLDNCDMGLLSFVSYTCSLYNYTSCYDGACIYNQLPVIHNVTSYGFDRRVTPNRFLHHSAYVVNETIMFNVNATDINGNDVYVAVDCDVNDMEGVSSWGGANAFNTTFSNCSYQSINNYTARLYVTDGYGGYWGNYTSYFDSVVRIQECFNYLDCNSGYLCSDIGYCYIPSNTTNCSDTDSGIYENVTGTVTVIWNNYTDYCYSGNVVYEYYCTNSSPNGYGAIGRLCSSGFVCYQGQCISDVNSSVFKIYVKDYNTYLPLSGITYTIAQYPSYDIVSTGTINNGEQQVSLPLGYFYQLLLQDSSGVYKQWWENQWYPDGSDVNAFMEKNCFGTCVYREYFSYTDSPYHHGWKGANYTTYYHSTLGFVGVIDYAVSSSDWYVEFPAPIYDVTVIKYDIQMANATPADGQSLKVYLRDSNAQDIFALWYVIDEVSGNSVWYFNTQWNKIPIATPYLSNSPIVTYLVYQKSTGTIDVYLDSLKTGNYIYYITDSPAINAVDLQRIEFDVVASPYSRQFYVDNIDMTQSNLPPSSAGSEGRTTDPTSPDAEDLQQAWYRDGEGNIKFDSSVCAGYNSMIWCGVSKYLMSKVASSVRWIFTGVHILYLIVMLILIIIIGPLVIEVFRPRK